MQKSGFLMPLLLGCQTMERVAGGLFLTQVTHSTRSLILVIQSQKAIFWEQNSALRYIQKCSNFFPKQVILVYKLNLRLLNHL